MKSDKQLIVECRKLFFEGDEGKNKETFDRCLLHVQEQGKSKDSAYAICKSAGAGEKKESIEPLQPYKSIFKEVYTPGLPEFSCGFAIRTESEDNIEEMYAEKGLVPDWNLLNKYFDKLERNTVRWLNKFFVHASDEGHDNTNDLIGTVWVKLNDQKQLDFIKKHYEDDPVDGGLYYDRSLYAGIPDDALVGDVYITFFNIPDEIKEMLDL